jgi:hypothetical protein
VDDAQIRELELVLDRIDCEVQILPIILEYLDQGDPDQ